MEIHSDTEHTASTKSWASSGVTGHRSKMSRRLVTSSYSRNRALLIRGWYSPSRLRRRTSRFAPESLINAPARTLVSMTMRGGMSQMIAHVPSVARGLSSDYGRKSSNSVQSRTQTRWRGLDSLRRAPIRLNSSVGCPEWMTNMGNPPAG